MLNDIRQTTATTTRTTTIGTIAIINATIRLKDQHKREDCAAALLLRCSDAAAIPIRLPLSQFACPVLWVRARERATNSRTAVKANSLSPQTIRSLSALTALSVCVCVLLLLVCKLHTFLRVSDDSSIEGLRSLSVSFSFALCLLSPQSPQTATVLRCALFK